MKTTVVLAMHGAPPNDFPPREMAELFGLHMRLEHAAGAERAMLESRHTELDPKVRAWPRTAQNDPFYAGSQELAEQLRQITGCDVILGFNEFCGPSLDEVLDKSAAGKADPAIVITPMIRRGGEHSEADIPAAIQRAQERYPETNFLYAWPFEASALAQFLATRIGKFVHQSVRNIGSREVGMFGRLGFHSDEMTLAFVVWLCSLPLVVLVVVPFFGLKVAGIVALVLLIVAMAICWGACGWKSVRERKG